MKSIIDNASAYGYAGSLPSGWHICQLGAVASEVISRNATLKMGREHVLSVDNEQGLVPSLRKLGDDFSRYKLIEPGQFAYNPMRLNVGSIALKQDNTPALVSPDYVVFKCCDNDLDPQFLDFYRRTQAWKASIARSGQGSVRVRYYFHHIAMFPMALPPLREQRAIARALRTVQAAKEACERVMAATRQLKHSLLAHLFTYGPVPFDQADKIELKETSIGPFPQAWHVARIGDLGDVITGTTPSTKHPEYYGAPHLFITPGDIGRGKYITQSEKSLTAAGLEKCRELPAGAVIVVCIGATIGKAGLTPVDHCATNQQCNSIVTNSKITSEFLYYAMLKRATVLPTLAGRAAVPIVNKSNFCDFEVPLPPLSQQQQIAAHLSAVDAKLEAEQARHVALSYLFQSLLHNLMTGRVRLPEFARGS